MKSIAMFDIIAVTIFVSLLTAVLIISYKEHNKGRFSQDQVIKL